MSLDNTALRLESAPFRIAEFFRKNYLSIARNTIEREIIREGIAAKMTAKQLSKLQIAPDNLDLVISIRTHGPTSGKEPRPKWRVAPDKKKALHWSVNGTNYFSKGHFVSGADAKYVLDHGIKRGLAKFRAEIKKQTETYMEENSIGRL